MCPPHEQQKSGLESVFGVGVIAQGPPANLEHHGGVAAHQLLEGRLVVAVGEAPQQIAVRGALVLFSAEGVAQIADDLGWQFDDHAGAPPETWACPLYAGRSGPKSSMNFEICDCDEA